MKQEMHKLKTWPEFFYAVKRGDKPFEVRKNDRDFKVGDYLLLEYWDPKTKKYNGEIYVCSISYVLPGGEFGIDKDYVVLGIK